MHNICLTSGMGNNTLGLSTNNNTFDVLDSGVEDEGNEEDVNDPSFTESDIGDIGTESWLSSSINNNEVFPTVQYNIERRDRPNDPHGGVFISTKKKLLATR